MHKRRSLPGSVGCALGVRWIPLPAGGDHLGGAVVSAFRSFLPWCGRAFSRARHHGLPLGDTHNAALRNLPTNCSPSCGTACKSTRPTTKPVP